MIVRTLNTSLSGQSDVESADDTASVTDNSQSAIQGLDSNVMCHVTDDVT